MYSIFLSELALKLIFAYLNCVGLSRAGQVCRVWYKMQKQEMRKRNMIQIMRLQPMSEVNDVITYYYDNLYVKPLLALLFFSEELSRKVQYTRKFACPCVMVTCTRVQMKGDLINDVSRYRSYSDINEKIGIIFILPEHSSILVKAIYTIRSYYCPSDEYLKKYVDQLDCTDETEPDANYDTNLLLFGAAQVRLYQRSSILPYINQRFQNRKFTAWGGNNYVKYRKGDYMIRNSIELDVFCMNVYGPRLTSWTIILHYLQDDRETFETQVRDFARNIKLSRRNYGLVNANVSVDENLPAFEECMRFVALSMPSIEFVVLIRTEKGYSRNFKYVESLVIGLKTYDIGTKDYVHKCYDFMDNVMSLIVISYN